MEFANNDIGEKTVKLETLKYLSDTYKKFNISGLNHVWKILISLVSLYLIVIGGSITNKLHFDPWLVWFISAALGLLSILFFINYHFAIEKYRKFYLKADSLITVV
jgi:predicted membrane metal-binding protein